MRHRKGPAEPTTELQQGSRHYAACVLFAVGLALVFLGDFSIEALPVPISISPGLWQAFVGGVYPVAAVVLAGAAWARPSVISRSVLSKTAAVAVVIGSACLLSSAALNNAALLLVGVVALACASVVLSVLWFWIATDYSSIWSKRCIVLTMLVEAVVKLIAPSAALAHGWVAALSLACSLGLAVAGKRLWETLRFRIEVERFDIRISFRSIAGLLAVAFGAMIALQAVVYSSPHSTSIYAFGLVFAAGILWLVLASRLLSSYARLIKIVYTLLIVSFALFPSAESPSLGLGLVSLTAGSLFWFGCMVFAIDVCTLSRSNPILLLSGTYALLACQSILGMLFAQSVTSWSSVLASNLFCGVMVVFLTIAALWLLRDRDVDEYLKGPTYPDFKEVSDQQANRYDVLARQYSLTPKEREIMEMYAGGRSAPYIAEDLVVSVNTVKSHLASIYQKMGIHSRQELITLVREK